MGDEHSATLLARLGDEADAQAWPDFLDAYAPLLLQAARGAVRDEEDAREAFVFVCERLVEQRHARLRHFDPQGSATFSTWLRIVAADLSLDWRRRRYGRPRLFQALRTLPPLHQAFFKARYAHGLTAGEAHGLLATGCEPVSAAELHAAEAEVERRLTWRHRLAIATRPAIATPESVEALADKGQEFPDIDGQRPDAEFLSRRRAAEVRRAIGRLPPADRLLVRLRFEQELTLREVARAAGLKDAQAADRHLRSILARLRVALEPTGPPVAKKAPHESV